MISSWEVFAVKVFTTGGPGPGRGNFGILGTGRKEYKEYMMIDREKDRNAEKRLEAGGDMRAGASGVNVCFLKLQFLKIVDPQK